MDHSTISVKSTSAKSSDSKQPEGSQFPPRTVNSEQTMVAMLDITALTNRIAMLEARLVATTQLLEQPFTLTKQLLDLLASNKQTSYSYSELTYPGMILSRIDAFEKQLANYLDRSQPPQEQAVENAVAKLLAVARTELINQLAQQLEQIQQIQRTAIAQQLEHKEGLTQFENRVVYQIEQLSGQLTAISQSITDLQKQQNRNTHPISPNLKSTSSDRDDHAASRRSTKTSKSRVDNSKGRASKSLAAEKDHPNKQNQRADVPEKQSSQAVVDAGSAKDGSIVINGEKKRLLILSEAFKVAQENGFTGNIRAFQKISERKESEKTYNSFGIGSLPERRGTKGQRKPWFYALNN